MNLPNFFLFLNQKDGRRVPFMYKMKYSPEEITQDDIDHLDTYEMFVALRENHGNQLIKLGRILPLERVREFSMESCFGLLRYAGSTRDFIILSKILGRDVINKMAGDGIFYLLRVHNPIRVAEVFGKKNMNKIHLYQRKDLLDMNNGENGFRDLFIKYGLI